MIDVNLAVIYYSATGTVHRMAEHAAASAEKAGATVRLRHVEEIAPQEAIAAAGLPADDTLVVSGDGTRESGGLAMDDLLRRAPDLDAVVIASDIMTAGALDTLDRRGVRVPADVAVVGFDDGEVAHARGITVIAQPIDELGATAAQLMLRVMAEGPGGIEPVSLPTRLVVRSST